MANIVLFANNDQTTLAGAITSVALTANLSPGSGVLFPAPATGQYFPMTFVDEATQLLREIVYVTNVTGDVITMIREQEGTTPLAWSAGDIAANLLTAGSMQLMTQTPQIQANAAIYAADTGTANSYAVALSPASPVPKIGATVYFKALNANTGASTLSLNAGTAYALNAGVGGALVPNAIVAGSFCEAQFNGTAFNLIYATGGIAQSATPPVGDVSTSDATTAWVNSLLNGQSNIALTNANVTLTAAQYGQYILNFTGVLTGNVVVFFPASVTGTWQVRNSTTGAYTLTLAVVGTPGSVLVVGSTAGSNTAVVYSDGTNVVNGTSAVGRLINVQVFTASGTYTPTTGTSSIVAEAVGGAGASGGTPATSSSQAAASSGGGSAAYAKGRFTSNFSGLTVTVGSGGTPGSAGSAGNSGGATSLGAILVAPGGAGGSAGIAQPYTTVVNSGNGTPISSLPTGANIVGIRGQGSAPSVIFNSTISQSSGGGSNPLGTGAPTAVNGGLGLGLSGTGYGSGPCGISAIPSTAALAGIAGQPGILIIYEYA